MNRVGGRLQLHAIEKNKKRGRHKIKAVNVGSQREAPSLWIEVDPEGTSLVFY